jgi:predicted ATPase
MLLHGWAEGYAGNRRAGIAEMRQGLAVIREQQIRIWLPFAMTVLAELEAGAGEIDVALATAESAIAETEETDQRWYEPETYRLRGALLLKSGRANDAVPELIFQRAIAIAQAQKTRSFELRAALDLAKLYRAADRSGDAYGVLAPALRGFSPTPEFPEIEEAQALLAALRSQQ